MKIDVFLIGVQKAGTSSLYDWVSQHPDINAPNLLKDYHYWVSPKLNKVGWSFIEKQFSDGDRGAIKMIGGVNYIYFREAPKLLFEHNPNCKLIIVLRNPIKRAISAFNYFTKLGVEHLGFQEAMQRETETVFSDIDDRANLTYLEHGLYAQQISNYLKYFKREQLHVLFFEDLILDKEAEMQNIFRFLQVDSNFIPEFIKVNETGYARWLWLNRLLFNGKSVSKIISIVSSILPISWRISFGNWIREVNRTSNQPSQNTSYPIEQLSDYYKSDIEKLESLLGVDVKSKWNLV